MDVIDELIAHCEAWEPWARVMGNVCAGDAAQALRSLRAELAEARRDAERYRWLRSDDCPFSCYEQEGPDNWGWCPTSSRDLDEAIDAAMAGDSAPESAATATRL